MKIPFKNIKINNIMKISFRDIKINNIMEKNIKKLIWEMILLLLESLKELFNASEGTISEYNKSLALFLLISTAIVMFL